MDIELIRKYNVPGPRYTSYPTVPYWEHEGFSTAQWDETVRRSFFESNEFQGISLYIHLPYCERLCTFCGCNRRITKNHNVEQPYIDAVLHEWELYRERFESLPRITEIHLGGGTPTFFSPDSLACLIQGIADRAELAESSELGFEAHPNSTTREHLQTLYDVGFRRLSLGVQELDPKVQEVINRIQPFETVARVTNEARDIGYESINFDLVYGLPLQRWESVSNTIDQVRTLMPERIAFYSYAHVPWIKGVGQRNYSEKDLPRDEEKRALYEGGRRLLEEAGYHEIGMDHFALDSDSLYTAAHNQTLHRNFMGYTPAHTQLSIGLGVSSISDSWYGFAQNEKKVDDYLARVTNNEIPIFRGHLLSDEDLVLRRHILNVMCRFTTTWSEPEQQHPSLFEGLERLGEMQDDGLVKIEDDVLTVPEAGWPFIRNICMALDARLWRQQPETQIFSQTI